MTRIVVRAAVVFLVPLLLFVVQPAESRGEEPFERTEERERCSAYDPLRRPFFGDLHVHTSLSFDSYTSGQRNDPWDAYRYAKGEAILLPDIDGEPTVSAKLRRPLDFVGLSDHAEFLGEMNLCTGEGWSLAKMTPHCVMTRSDNFLVALIAAGSWSQVIGERGEERKRVWQCGLPGSDCEGRMIESWEKIQQAAEDHYDRSAECRFTTFVGYEYTDTPGFYNMHRNVIFRNDRVTKAPISAYDTGSENFPELWRRLRNECIDAGNGCDVVTIPHNSNLSGGLMFRDPRNEEEANDRLFFEPVVELIQHKAASECRFDRLAGRGVDTADELCTFEQNKTDNLNSLGVLYGEVQSELGAPVPLDEFAPRNMVRNALKAGLALERSSGVNPFKMGFIGSTDTHSAVPGGTMEDDYVGHLGRRDTGYRNVQDHLQDNPGGLAVVWAEENSRDSIFAGMRRKEAYATSGTRPIVRFFGGWDLDTDACAGAGTISHGYARGVPMGGDLPKPSEEAGGPRFLVSALKDPGTTSHPGTDLQRIQIVKGWVDAQGETHELVYDVIGDRESEASVDPDTCAPTGRGAASLCTVWEDLDFDASLGAFYYARVLENPTCRWSTLQCQTAGVNPFASDCSERAAEKTAALQEEGARGDVWGQCCFQEEEEPFLERVIQERAWTSPIWYRP